MYNGSSVDAVIAHERHVGARCPVCSRDVSIGQRVCPCPGCGAVHHERCWVVQGCQAYACAPVRREGLEDELSLVITERDLDRAVPLSAGPSSARRQAGGSDDAAPGFVGGAPRRTSRLAIASLVLGVLGIPLLGLVTGLFAILVGLLGLAGIRGTRMRGAGYACAGITLGAIDFVGWLLALVILLDVNVLTPKHGTDLVDLRPDPKALEGLDPVLARGLRANVLLERRLGLLGSSIGSGVILKIDGGEALIVTNRHVIDPQHGSGPADLNALNDGRLKVMLISQEVSEGRIVWIAPHGVDLALVRASCHSTEVKTARWQAGRVAHVGDNVFAVGNPHQLGWTHTEGAISQFRVTGEGAGAVRLVQTQAALNPGNSGGGLYTRDGWLIGINTSTYDKRFSEGLGFAIDLDSLLKLSPPGLDQAGGADQLP